MCWNELEFAQKCCNVSESYKRTRDCKFVSIIFIDLSFPTFYIASTHIIREINSCEII